MESINKNSLYFLMFFLVMCGCVQQESYFKKVAITAKLNKEFSLSSKSAEIAVIDTVYEDIVYNIEFEAVRGGASKFMGNILSESNGYESNRLTVHRKGNEFMSLSIHLITNHLSDTVNVNLNKFLIGGVRG